MGQCAAEERSGRYLVVREQVESPPLRPPWRLCSKCGRGGERKAWSDSRSTPRLGSKFIPPPSLAGRVRWTFSGPRPARPLQDGPAPGFTPGSRPRVNRRIKSAFPGRCEEDASLRPPTGAPPGSGNFRRGDEGFFVPAAWRLIVKTRILFLQLKIYFIIKIIYIIFIIRHWRRCRGDSPLWGLAAVAGFQRRFGSGRGRFDRGRLGAGDRGRPEPQLEANPGRLVFLLLDQLL